MFKWIHLSDLHFQGRENYGIECAREQLADYLMRKVGECDAVFATGDFRYAQKSKGDIKSIVSFLSKIKESIKAKYIICVPGNHDLERSKMRTAVIDGVLGDYNPESNRFFDEEMLQNLKKGFNFYDQMLEELPAGYSDSMKEDIHKVVELPECCLLLLNTAITAGKDDERGSLIMGIDLVERAVKRLNREKPLIILGHHGASFWNRNEQKVLYHLLEKQKAKLYLCGHEHALFSESIGNNAITQITSGCMESSENGQLEVGFDTGEMDSGGRVEIHFHVWNNEARSWGETDRQLGEILLMQPKKRVNQEVREPMQKLNYPSSEKKEFQFTLNGHTLLGSRGMYGIKYYWKKGEESVESLAFNQRLCESSGDVEKDKESKQISAYTTSVSFGCMLAANLSQCRFCETGSRNFRGFLSAEEIAMQNIFMATYDSACPSYPEVKTHKREFSFMGQGEPGYNYPAVREAIRLTDIAMEKIGQTVYRYNISTCGVRDFIPVLIEDIKSGIFHNTVTLHYSLHAIGKERTRLMPVNAECDYREFIECCTTLYQETKRKIGVGLLMFKDFSPVKRSGESDFEPCSLTEEKLEKILDELDSDAFSIDLCDLNRTTLVSTQQEVSNEEARKLLKIAKDKGFEAKIFSSFASEQRAGCGMLSSEYIDTSNDGEKTVEQYKRSLELLNYSIYQLKTKQ